MDESEAIPYRITHKRWSKNGQKMSVVAQVGALTIDKLVNGSKHEVARAQTTLCNKFRRAAAREFYDSKWPEDKVIDIDDLDFGEIIDAPQLQPSSQQRAKRS